MSRARLHTRTPQSTLHKVLDQLWVRARCFVFGDFAAHIMETFKKAKLASPPAAVPHTSPYTHAYIKPRARTQM